MDSDDNNDCFFNVSCRIYWKVPWVYDVSVVLPFWFVDCWFSIINRCDKTERIMMKQRNGNDETEKNETIPNKTKKCTGIMILAGKRKHFLGSNCFSANHWTNSTMANIDSILPVDGHFSTKRERTYTFSEYNKTCCVVSLCRNTVNE